MLIKDLPPLPEGFKELLRLDKMVQENNLEALRDEVVRSAVQLGEDAYSVRQTLLAEDPPAEDLAVMAMLLRKQSKP